jgi:hypothetical protein
MNADDIRSRLIQAASPSIRAGELDGQDIERTVAQTGLW